VPGGGQAAGVDAHPLGNAEELDELEELVTDAIRFACKTGDLGTTEALTRHAEALAYGSDMPHRQANTLYCRGLLGHDPALLLQGARRYSDATRPLLAAKALEAAASEFRATSDRGQVRAAFTNAVEIYSSMGAAI
jgi:hypothetical protein